MEVKLVTSRQPMRRNDTVLITGDGRSLPADFETFRCFDVPYDVYAIGRSINFVPHATHWGNVDSAESIWWAENLPDKWTDGPQRHTLGPMRGYDFDWDIPQCGYAMEDILWHGSTSLFCVFTSLAMGYKRVVLAGCPMDSSGHWYFGPEHVGPRWTGECFMAWLDFRQSPQSESVRSMSGYTKTILGEPNQAWLSGRQK